MRIFLLEDRKEWKVRCDELLIFFLILAGHFSFEYFMTISYVIFYFCCLLLKFIFYWQMSLGHVLEYLILSFPILISPSLFFAIFIFYDFENMYLWQLIFFWIFEVNLKNFLIIANQFIEISLKATKGIRKIVRLKEGIWTWCNSIYKHS